MTYLRKVIMARLIYWIILLIDRRDIKELFLMSVMEIYIDLELEKETIESLEKKGILRRKEK